MRIHYDVHMVRHSNPRVKPVSVQLILTVRKSIRHHPGDSRILHPHRTSGTDDRILSCVSNRRSSQPPRHKDGSLLRYPVRQMPTVKRHAKTIVRRPVETSQVYYGLQAETDDKKRSSVPSAVLPLERLPHLARDPLQLFLRNNQRRRQADHVVVGFLA